MTFTPSPSLRSLVLVSWRRADYLVDNLARWIGLGLTGCRPFLRRSDRARLAASLAHFEALARRLLVLMALEAPLPQVRAGQARAPGAGGRPGPRPPVSLLDIPRFRLTERTARTLAAPPQPPRRPRGGPRPRLLYLDRPLPPPEPWEYPPRPDDLVPAQPLVRRLRALCAVFNDPVPHIARMGRHLARARLDAARPPLLRDRLPAAALTRHVPRTEREALRDIHTEARRLIRPPDTS